MVILRHDIVVKHVPATCEFMRFPKWTRRQAHGCATVVARQAVNGLNTFLVPLAVVALAVSMTLVLTREAGTRLDKRL